MILERNGGVAGQTEKVSAHHAEAPGSRKDGESTTNKGSPTRLLPYCERSSLK